MRLSQKAAVAPREASPSAKRGRRWAGVAACTAIALIIGIAAVSPFYLSRYEKSEETGEVYRLFVTHDLVMHLPQAQDFDRVLRSGVIYPRWLPNVNHGYGVVTLVFYPPGQFYLMALFNWLFGDWVNGLFALSALGLAASGLAFFIYARLFLGRVASGLAAILYMLIPFHMLNLYWQGAIPQFLGYAFMPLVMYFAYKSGRHGKPQHMAALGLIYGLYVLTHLPVSYLFTYVLALYAIVWAISERDWRVAFRISIGMALGLLLSAIYWLPAALESKYIYEWASELLSYHNTYFTLPLPTDYFLIIINLVFLIQALSIALAIAMLAPTVFKGKPVREGAGHETTKQVRIWALLAVVTTIFNTSLAAPVLKLVPRIQVATPAWRWLAVAGFFGCLLIAAAVEKLSASDRKPLWRVLVPRAAMVAVFIITILFSARYIVVEALASPTYKPPAVYVDSGFTPKGSTPPDRLPDVPLVRLEPGKGTSEIIRWDPQLRVVKVACESPGYLRLKTYNYPGWTAKVDGRPNEIKTDLYGAQMIEVSAGEHTVEIAFVNTPPRTLGAIISGIALLAMAGLALAGSVRRSARTTPVAIESPKVETPKVEPPEHSPRRFGLEGGVKILAQPKLALGAAGLIIIIALGAFLLFRQPVDTPDVSPSAQDAGEASRVFVEGYNRITVASDERVFEELIGALSSRNQSKIQSLIDSGRAFDIENNARVRPLGASGSKAKVLILEGKHAGTEAWVLDRWIRNK